MRVTLIHDPESGSQIGCDELQSLIRRAGHEVGYHSSKQKGRREALEDPADLVATAGDDGTVTEVAKALIGRGVRLAILPSGTANNIATTLGIVDKPLQELISGWPAARPLAIDAGVIEEPWGTSFSSRVMERLEQYPARDVFVTLDGRDFSASYILLEAMNMQFIGPNLYLAPEADPGDGLLDFVLLQHGEHDNLTKCLLHPRKEKPSGLTVVKGKRLEIACTAADISLG